MNAELQMMESAKPNKHVIFVKDEKEYENFDLAEHFNTVPELVDVQYNRLTKEQLEKETIAATNNPRELRSVTARLK